MPKSRIQRIALGSRKESLRATLAQPTVSVIVKPTKICWRRLMSKSQLRPPLVSTTIGAIFVGVIVSLVGLGFEYGLFQKVAPVSRETPEDWAKSDPPPPPTSPEAVDNGRSEPEVRKIPEPVRWTRVALAIPAGFQHASVQVDGSPARVLGRLPNFIDIQVPNTGELIVVHIENKQKVCEKEILASPETSQVSICSEDY